MKILKNMFWTNYNDVDHCRVKKKNDIRHETTFSANKIKKC